MPLLSIVSVVLTCCSGRVEQSLDFWVQPKSLNYLLSDSLEKKFVKSWSSGFMMCWSRNVFFNCKRLIKTREKIPQNVNKF